MIVTGPAGVLTVLSESLERKAVEMSFSESY